MTQTIDSFSNSSPEWQPGGCDPTPHLRLVSPVENAGDFYNTPTQLVHGKVHVDDEPTEFTAEFPLEPVLPDVNLIVAGFGGFKRTSRSLRHNQAAQGLASVSYDPYRADRRSNKERLQDPQQLHLDTLAAIYEELLGNSELQDQIPHADEFDFEHLVIEPHSMGGLPAMRLAAERSDAVKAVMGLATVGFGSPTPCQLITSFATGALSSLEKELIPYLFSGDIERTPRNAFRAAHYYARNPIRTFGEMLSCLGYDLEDHVVEARRLGVYTAYLAFEHDLLVPETAAVAEHVDHYEVMPDTGHVAPQAKAAKVADWVINHQQELHGVGRLV